MSDPTRQPCAGSVRTTGGCNPGPVKVEARKNVSTMKNEAGASVAPFVRKDFSDACNTTPLTCRPAPWDAALPGGYGSGMHVGHAERWWSSDVNGNTSEPGVADWTEIPDPGGEHCTSKYPDALVRANLPADVDGPPIVTRLGNTFAATDPATMVSRACAELYGMKSTQAVKAWHGAFPFTHDANGVHCQYPWKKWNGSSYDLHATDIGGCVPNRSNVKYLTRQFTVSNYRSRLYYRVATQVNVGGTNYGKPSGEYNALAVGFSADVTRTVGKDSGKINSGGTAAAQTIENNTVSEVYYPGGTPRYIEFTAGSAMMVACANISSTAPGLGAGLNIKDDILTSPRCLTDLPLFNAVYIGGVGTGWPTHLDNYFIAAGVAHFVANPLDGDQITVGSKTYTFKNSPASGDEIQIGSDVSGTFGNYQIKLAYHPQVNLSSTGGGVVYLERKAGVTATIALSSTAPSRVLFGASALPPAKTIAGWTWADTIIRPFFGVANDTATVAVTVTRTAIGYSWSVNLKVSHDLNTGTAWAGCVFSEVELAYSGTITLSDPYEIGNADPLATDPNVLRDAAELAAEWKLRDKRASADDKTYLQHPWRSDEHVFEAVLVSRDEKRATSPEINFDACPKPNYAAEKVDGEWPLGDWWDDACLKWNNDPPDEDYTQNHLVSTGIYTGNIIGKPLPAGYGAVIGGSPRGSFDPFYVNWQRKFCTDHCVESFVSRGAWNPSYIPSNAQRWTAQDAWPHYTFANYGGRPNYAYPCSFVKANAAGVWLQKMVEAIVPKPSYDFTRPHTADRFLLEQPTDPEALTRIYYVAGVAGSVVTLNKRNGYAATDVTGDFTAGDIVGVVTGPDGAGFYTVASVSGGTVTLGALKWKVPTGFTNGSGDADRAFGKVRYPAAPGFSGLLPVAATDSSGDTLLTYAARTCIQTGDKVDLWNGSAFDDNSGAGYELTRLTDATATISGAHLDTKAIVPHRYAVIDPETSAPLSGQKWWYGDARAKGDYVTRTWTVNLDSGAAEQSIAATATQRCLPLGKPCGFRVAGFAPQYVDPETGNFIAPTNEHDDQFANARIEVFPLFVANGNEWVGEVEQHMVDPLWQTPHKPDAEGYAYADIRWHMDDGSCQADYDDGGILYKFYALPAFYEARISSPGGYGPAHDKTAPALIAGLPALDTAQPVPATGTIGGGCSGDTNFNFADRMPTTAKPWGIYYRQQSCVCAAGRFYEAYRANKVVC